MFLDLLSRLTTILYAIMFVVVVCLLVSGTRRKEMKDSWSKEAGSLPSEITFKEVGPLIV